MMIDLETAPVTMYRVKENFKSILSLVCNDANVACCFPEMQESTAPRLSLSKLVVQLLK